MSYYTTVLSSLSALCLFCKASVQFSEVTQSANFELAGYLVCV